MLVLAGDAITAVQFDQTGEFLATGDRGGNVTLYRGSEVESEEVSREPCLARLLESHVWGGCALSGCVARM